MDDKATAAKIVADPMNAVSETAMEAAIVRALQAARTPPTGHIIDDAGVVLKLSGALPVTADRVVVCYASTPLWHPILGQMDTLAGEPYATWRNGMGKRTSECYSTPEAAEAAKEGKE